MPAPIPLSLPLQIRQLQIAVWLYFTGTFMYARCSSQCDVYVSRPPWPMEQVYVPQNSTLEVDCAADSSDVQARFIIDIPGVENDLQFIDGPVPQKSILEQHGLFQLGSDGLSQSMKTLLINNTVGNNQTVIKCNLFGTGQTYQFTLFTYEPRAVMLTYDSGVDSLSENALNISWSRDSTPSDITMVFNLTVNLDGRITDTIFNLTEMHYYFSIRGASSSCQIYNFSVTATPVDATYTGDGCSVPSPVLSKMLPSLPDITTLANSLNHTLETQFGVGFRLNALIMPANFCEEYPVTDQDYVLEVEGPTTSSMSITPGNISTVDNLLENEIYSFHIIVSNSVGNVSTNKTTVYTTDVQDVTAVSSQDNAFTVQCVFVTGSTARGCIVVLVGQPHNITVNLTREGLSAAGTVSTGLIQASCITEVIGYDIESDGTIGTLPLSGDLSIGSQEMCMVENPMSGPLLVIVIPLAMMMAAMVMVVAVVIVIVLIRRKRKLKKRSVVTDQEPSPNSSLNTACTTIEETDQAAPLYDLPSHKQNVGVRTAGDGEDHSTNQYKSTNHTQYAELLDSQEHMYHVLECDRPPRGVEVPPLADDILPDEDAPPLPPPYNPEQESQTPPPPPVYQDISCLTSRGAVVNGMDT